MAWHRNSDEQQFTHAEVGAILDQLVDAMLKNKVAVISQSLLKRLPFTVDSWFQDYFTSVIKSKYKGDTEVAEALWNCAIVTQHNMGSGDHKIAFKSHDQAYVSDMKEVRIHFIPPGYNMGVCNGWFNNGLH